MEYLGIENNYKNYLLSPRETTFFQDYKQISCGTGDDFMDYITSKVSVPIYNNLEEFNLPFF